MNTKYKFLFWETAKRISIILIMISVVLFFSSCVLEPFLVNKHVRYLKESLNNEIVNQDYPGWCAQALDQGTAIYLPSSWTLNPGTNKDNLWTIVDSDGSLIAVGNQVSEYDSNTSAAFLQAYYGCAVTSYEPDIIGSGRYANAAQVYRTETIFQDGTVRKHIKLHLPSNVKNSTVAYNFYFFSLDYETEAVAIAWSLEDSHKVISN